MCLGLAMLSNTFLFLSNQILYIQRTAKELKEDRRVGGIASLAWCHLSWMESQPPGTSICELTVHKESN